MPVCFLHRVVFGVLAVKVNSVFLFKRTFLLVTLYFNFPETKWGIKSESKLTQFNPEKREYSYLVLCEFQVFTCCGAYLYHNIHRVIIFGLLCHIKDSGHHQRSPQVTAASKKRKSGEKGRKNIKHSLKKKIKIGFELYLKNQISTSLEYVSALEENIPKINIVE